ncbi:hypothetical protein AGMMS50267_08100 [Spirochaetia bacterium]|nr:hypothetical protein AGMMS50267_08100 [Spirochaetia bacterium]
MTTRQTLDAIAAKRILILDGAMGTMVQTWHLTEDDFRGSRFADHRVNLSGCNDLLCLTRPDVISAIHEAYLEAGADIIESCSFNATSVSLADYGIGDLAYEINAAAAALARKAAGRVLSGQTVEAFCFSVLHADPVASAPWSIGLNCSFLLQLRLFTYYFYDILLLFYLILQQTYSRINALAILYNQMVLSV